MKTVTLAIFDIDGTLFDFDTGVTLLRYLYKKGVISFFSLVELFLSYFLVKWHVIKDFSQKEFAFLRQLTPQKIEVLAEEYYEHTLKNKVHHIMKHHLEKHRKQHHLILLLSASPQVLVEKIKRELKADFGFGSILEEKDGHFTGRYAFWNYGKNKVKMLSDFLQQHKLKVKESYFYSDSISDLPLFLNVTHPIVVNPDKQLQKMALLKHWPKILLRKEKKQNGQKNN